MKTYPNLVSDDVIIVFRRYRVRTDGSKAFVIKEKLALIITTEYIIPFYVLIYVHSGNFILNFGYRYILMCR